MEVPTYVPFNGRTGPFAPFLAAMEEDFLPLNGYGSPEGVVPSVPPQPYIDLDTNNLWIKMQGTQTLGWFLVGPTGTGPGGILNNVFRSSVDPDGVQNCTGAGVVIGDGAMAGKIWVKGTPGTSNSEWGLLIG